MTLVIAALALFYAWRYCKMEIDPDWAYFNMYAFTGAMYGRDFPDCKMPTIHIYYWLLSKLVGKNIVRIRFAHHIIMSVPGVLVGGWVGLAYVVLVNSGWLIAFHGNVGQPAAAAVMLAMWFNDPILSAILAILAVGVEPKMLPSALLMSVISGWWVWFGVFAFVSIIAALLIWKFYPTQWGWLWEANITLPKRMTAMRKELLKQGKITFMPQWSSLGYLYCSPWLVLGMISKPDILFWLPVFVYILLLYAGIVVRSNHLLPLAPWIAYAISPQAALALVVVEFITSGGFIGDLWQRFYPGLHQANIDAREVGTWLKDKPGNLWVNGFHSAIYLHARKPIHIMAEQAEIQENVPERREKWRAWFKATPPEFVVVGAMSTWPFNGNGYKEAAKSQISTVYQRRN